MKISLASSILLLSLASANAKNLKGGKDNNGGGPPAPADESTSCKSGVIDFEILVQNELDERLDPTTFEDLRCKKLFDMDLTLDTSILVATGDILDRYYGGRRKLPWGGGGKRNCNSNCAGWGSNGDNSDRRRLKTKEDREKDIAKTLKDLMKVECKAVDEEMSIKVDYTFACLD